MANQDDVFGTNDDAINGKKPPSQKFVDWLHAQASTRRSTDIHHRLGTGEDEASPGNHDHDGKNSMPLFPEETVLTDLTGAATMAQVAASVNAINAALRSKGAS